MKIKALKIKNLVFFGLITSVTVFACTQPKAEIANTTEQKSTEASSEELAAKGKYLVGIMGCNDCHSPKVFGPQGPSLDPERLLSGHPAELTPGKFDPSIFSEWVLFNHHNTAAAGPWGISFAANLTSDETGIGNWSFEQFKKAMKEGKNKGLDGGRMLLPPMPWPNFANITDEDLQAIFAYLKSTKPVKNVVPSPVAPAGPPPGAGA